MYTSTKTPEQLRQESKAKSEAAVLKAAGLLEKVSRKRDTEQALKQHLKETANDLRLMSKEVGKV